MAKNEFGTCASWQTALITCHWRNPPSPANAILPPPTRKTTQLMLVKGFQVSTHETAYVVQNVLVHSKYSRLTATVSQQYAILSCSRIFY